MRNEEIRAEFLISLIKHSLVFWKSNVPTIAKINWKTHGQTSKHTKEAEATRPTTKFPAMPLGLLGASFLESLIKKRWCNHSPASLGVELLWHGIVVLLESPNLIIREMIWKLI